MSIPTCPNITMANPHPRLLIETPHPLTESCSTADPSLLVDIFSPSTPIIFLLDLPQDMLEVVGENLMRTHHMPSQIIANHHHPHHKSDFVGPKSKTESTTDKSEDLRGVPRSRDHIFLISIPSLLAILTDQPPSLQLSLDLTGDMAESLLASISQFLSGVLPRLLSSDSTTLSAFQTGLELLGIEPPTSSHTPPHLHNKEIFKCSAGPFFFASSKPDLPLTPPLSCEPSPMDSPSPKCFSSPTQLVPSMPLPGIAHTAMSRLVASQAGPLPSSIIQSCALSLLPLKPCSTHCLFHHATANFPRFSSANHALSTLILTPLPSQLPVTLFSTIHAVTYLSSILCTYPQVKFISEIPRVAPESPTIFIILAIDSAPPLATDATNKLLSTSLSHLVIVSNIAPACLSTRRNIISPPPVSNAVTFRLNALARLQHLSGSCSPVRNPFIDLLPLFRPLPIKNYFPDGLAVLRSLITQFKLPAQVVLSCLIVVLAFPKSPPPLPLPVEAPLRTLRLLHADRTPSTPLLRAIKAIFSSLKHSQSPRWSIPFNYLKERVSLSVTCPIVCLEHIENLLYFPPVIKVSEDDLAPTLSSAKQLSSDSSQRLYEGQNITCSTQKQQQQSCKCIMHMWSDCPILGLPLHANFIRFVSSQITDALVALLLCSPLSFPLCSHSRVRTTSSFCKSLPPWDTTFALRVILPWAAATERVTSPAVRIHILLPTLHALHDSLTSDSSSSRRRSFFVHHSCSTSNSFFGPLWIWPWSNWIFLCPQFTNVFASDSIMLSPNKILIKEAFCGLELSLSALRSAFELGDCSLAEMIFRDYCNSFIRILDHEAGVACKNLNEKTLSFPSTWRSNIHKIKLMFTDTVFRRKQLNSDVSFSFGPNYLPVLTSKQIQEVVISRILPAGIIESLSWQSMLSVFVHGLFSAMCVQEFKQELSDTQRGSTTSTNHQENAILYLKIIYDLLFSNTLTPSSAFCLSRVLSLLPPSSPQQAIPSLRTVLRLRAQFLSPPHLETSITQTALCGAIGRSLSAVSPSDITIRTFDLAMSSHAAISYFLPLGSPALAVAATNVTAALLERQPDLSLLYAVDAVVGRLDLLLRILDYACTCPDATMLGDDGSWIFCRDVRLVDAVANFLCGELFTVDRKSSQIVLSVLDTTEHEVYSPEEFYLDVAGEATTGIRDPISLIEAEMSLKNCDLTAKRILDAFHALHDCISASPMSESVSRLSHLSENALAAESILIEISARHTSIREFAASKRLPNVNITSTPSGGEGIAEGDRNIIHNSPGTTSNLDANLPIIEVVSNTLANDQEYPRRFSVITEDAISFISAHSNPLYTSNASKFKSLTNANDFFKTKLAPQSNLFIPWGILSDTQIHILRMFHFYQPQVTQQAVTRIHLLAISEVLVAPTLRFLSLPSLSMLTENTANSRKLSSKKSAQTDRHQFARVIEFAIDEDPTPPDFLMQKNHLFATHSSNLTKDCEPAHDASLNAPVDPHLILQILRILRKAVLSAEQTLVGMVALSKSSLPQDFLNEETVEAGHHQDEKERVQHTLELLAGGVWRVNKLLSQNVDSSHCAEFDETATEGIDCFGEEATVLQILFDALPFSHPSINVNTTKDNKVIAASSLSKKQSKNSSSLSIFNRLYFFHTSLECNPANNNSRKGEKTKTKVGQNWDGDIQEILVRFTFLVASAVSHLSLSSKKSSYPPYFALCGPYALVALALTANSQPPLLHDDNATNRTNQNEHLQSFSGLLGIGGSVLGLNEVSRVAQILSLYYNSSTG